MNENEKYKQKLLKAQQFCIISEKCKFDMQIKLASWGVSEEISNKIIRQLTIEKFINDERFAKAFVHDKLFLNQWGKIKINYHLKQKKIPSSIIEKVLQSVDNEKYVQMLRSVIEKKKQHIKSRNRYDLKAKILRFAQSRGFENELVFEILNEE